MRDKSKRYQSWCQRCIWQAEGGDPAIPFPTMMLGYTRRGDICRCDHCGQPDTWNGLAMVLMETEAERRQRWEKAFTGGATKACSSIWPGEKESENADK